MPMLTLAEGAAKLKISVRQFRLYLDRAGVAITVEPRNGRRGRPRLTVHAEAINRLVRPRRGRPRKYAAE